jgi:prevent-host-death family protein
MENAMPANRWSLQDAKNKFSAVVDAALQGHPQLVTRRGRDAVVVISSEDYARLRRQGRATQLNFKEYLLTMPLPASGEEDEFERIPVKPREVDL